jgi:L-asparaginase
VRWWGGATVGAAPLPLELPVQAWPPAAQWPVVDIVMSHAAARVGLLDAVARSGVQGIVVAATGNGTVHEALLSGLERVRAQGIEVVVASRCLRGSMVRSTVAERTPYDDLTPVQARIRLMLALMRRS